MGDIKTSKTSLYLGDCFDKLNLIPDKSIDLVIFDPPYLINQGKSGGAFGKNKQKYHADLEDIINGFDFKLFNLLHQKMKKINYYVFANKTLFFDLVNYHRNHHPELLLDILIWNKTNPIPVCHNKYLSDCEYVLFVKEKGVPIAGTFSTKKKVFQSPMNVKDKKKYKHPTPKPVPFLNNLITNSSKEGDTVLDMFMGSGSTGESALLLNRKFVGIELNPSYFETAKTRLAQIDNEILKHPELKVA